MSLLRSKLIERQRQVRECGQIRIGAQKPERGVGRPLETFRFTSESHDKLTSVAEVYGGEVTPWTPVENGRTVNKGWQITIEQKVIKAYFSMKDMDNGDIESLSMSRDVWAGGTHVRQCDGETCLIWQHQGRKDWMDRPVADRVPVPCLCKQGQPDPKGECKLKVTCRLLLSEVPSIGLWRLTSGSETFGDEIAGLVSQLRELGLQGAYVPVTLKIGFRTKRTGPGEDNSTFPVVGVEFDENPASLPQLMASIQQQMLGVVSNANGYGELPATSTPSLPASAPAIASSSESNPATVLLEWATSIGIDPSEIVKFQGECRMKEVSWTKKIREAKESGVSTPQEFDHWWAMKAFPMIVTQSGGSE